MYPTAGYTAVLKEYLGSKSDLNFLVKNLLK